jgi:hypothetical protein
MGEITEIKTTNAPKPLPVFSQAIKANGMVFCSGNIGLDKDTWTLVEGGIKAQTVYHTLPITLPTSLLLMFPLKISTDTDVPGPNAQEHRSGARSRRV